ncbi:tubby C-terminal-like domain-containing protein [Podospora australis]|uniref:Tubby C-terminal-like domain-containing protein n=1 Tax=Podospora australis TaxID=1536484 RepID=A0AAN7AF15_9PEZI|nr:tubby C-terminal-like domain-containing protein [Podospora australis]
MARQLLPVPQPLAVFDQFITPHPQTLVLKEGFMDSFDIKNVNGQPIFRVEGKILTAHGRKSFFDMQGNHLFDLIKELLHYHATFACETPGDKRKVLKVKSKFALLGSKARATFTNSRTGQPVTLAMDGNWFDTTAEIKDATTGVIVARIDRKLMNMGEAFLGKQTYHLTIAPGVDMTLIVAMAIALDEKNNEGQGGWCGVM